MTEERLSRASSSESDPSTTKRRKKRMWDQPDESLFYAGVAHPGFSPLTSMGSLAGAALSSASVSASSLAIPFSTSVVTPVQLVQIPLQQHVIVQKLLQPKMQDELIAREIVINDADSAIRYKLTKRQTQEELQKSTGAVVITRGKYRPPNAPADGERPLYLHISGASHLETTAQRIKAVDQAAAMVEEMLKQETASNGVKSDHVLSTCVFLGFEADPSLDIVSRIRGPNDQYVNHIMNETGATISVRGLGSGYSENGQTEDPEQPLHLLLSSNDAKKLEHAKLLAENLLDTISADCGQSRVSSCKVYGAVPPPPQLQSGVSYLGNASKVHDSDALCSTSSAGVSSIPSLGLLSQSIRLPNPALPVANTPCVPFSLASGTSYMGYGGIYPQATPLQQVALVLKQSTSQVTATVAPLVTSASNDHPDKVTAHVVEKRSKRRKFQEMPASATRPASPNQGSDFHMPPDPALPSLQDPGQLIKPSSNGVLLPPPRRLLPPPPPPPKFNSAPKSRGDNGIQILKTESLPDTLIKLTEYGDDDGDDD